jgi:hypothetical protein
VELGARHVVERNIDALQRHATPGGPHVLDGDMASVALCDAVHLVADEGPEREPRDADQSPDGQSYFQPP